MRVIECEILGNVEIYIDKYDMPREWHEKQLKRIAATAHIRIYKRAYTMVRRKMQNAQTIEDLFIKSRQNIKVPKRTNFLTLKK